MEKLKRLFFGETARAALSALLIFMATYCAFPERGILTTLPFVVLVGLVTPFLYDEARVLVAASALSSLLLALVQNTARDVTMFYIITPIAFFLASYGASRLMRHFGKKQILFFLGVCLTCVTVFLWFNIFGDPLSLTRETSETETLYRTRYPKEHFLTQEAYFDPVAREYRVVFETEEKLTFIATKTNDGYFSQMKERAFELQKDSLLVLLHEHFEDGNYQVTIHPGEIEPSENCPYRYGDAPEEWLKKSDITLEFASSIALGSQDAKYEFSTRVRAYVKLLQEEGFPFGSITIRGGEQDTMIYELSATPTTSPEELSLSNIKDLRR